MSWKFETSGLDGQCKLFDVNIFDYDWKSSGKRVKVQDPIYGQDHIFEIWQTEIGDRFDVLPLVSFPTACGDFIWKIA